LSIPQGVTHIFRIPKIQKLFNGPFKLRTKTFSDFFLIVKNEVLNFEKEAVQAPLK
jgi:hypothetical protein